MGARAIQLAFCVFLLAGAACAGPQPSENAQPPTSGPEASAMPSPRPQDPSPATQTATPTSTTPRTTPAAELPIRTVEIVRLPRGTIEQIACSPQAKTVAVATSLGVQLYDTQALRSVGHLADVPWPTGIDFAPDGSLLVTASAAGTQLWDVASGALKESIAADHLATSVAFSPDGRFLALGESQALTLWDLANNEARHTWPSDSTVSGVTFSADGKLLAATFEYGSMAIWDTSTGELSATLDSTGSKRPPAFAPDLQSVAAAMGEVRVLDVATGQPLAIFSDWPHVARSVAFAADAPLLASGGDGDVRIWDLANGQPVAALEHPGLVDVLAFCGDGELLVSGGGGELRLWDVTSQEPRGVAAGFEGSSRYWGREWVRAIALSPHGELLASAHDDNRVYLWDLRTGDLTVALDQDAPIESLSFSPDGTHLASGGADGTVRLWDISGGGPSPILQHGATVLSTAFSPDGGWLAAAGDDGTVKLWQVSQHEMARTLLQGGPVPSIAFSPDGRLLASACADGFVRLWEMTRGSLSGSLQPGGSVELVTFSRDGKSLATVGGDGAVGLWDVATQTLQASYRGFGVDSVRGAAFWPDDAHLLVVEQSNGQVDIWDTVTGELTYSSITRSLNGRLALSSDGALLALGRTTGTVLLGNLGVSQQPTAPAPPTKPQPEQTGEMVLIPAGEFQMGCVETGQYPRSCGDGDTLRTIYLGAYSIDKYEVTNAQYAACVDDDVCLAPDAFSIQSQARFGDPAYADHPVVRVSWFDARAYCTWAGKRLPTEAEWVKAARGEADARIYPWGNEPPDCSRTTFSPSDTGRLEDCEPGTSPVGSHPAGASPYGVMDMCSNVGEWVSDWYQSYYHRTSPDRNPSGPAAGTQKIEFGSHMTPTSERVRIDHPLLAPPGLHSWNLGFRCASSAEPGIPGAATRTPEAGTGAQGNGDSDSPSISADGRYVVFDSLANNLVPGDTNGEWDVFVHDRQTGQTTRVSVTSGGVQANLDSWSASISADGRYVTFASEASNLVPDDTNGQQDIYLHDRQTSQTTRVSVAWDGVQANDGSSRPTISADGRSVVFCSTASNLVPWDSSDTDDIYVHDRLTGETLRIPETSPTVGGKACSDVPPDITADGRYVVFRLSANDLEADDENDAQDIYVYDRLTGQTERASSAPGVQIHDGRDPPAISADGRYVAFASGASDLVSGDTNETDDVFVHDRLTGETWRVSVASDGSQADGGSYLPSISADGRSVAFYSYASNLVPDDTNGVADIFVHDRNTGETVRASVASDGMEGNWSSYGSSSLSADGRYVAFWSGASNLVAGDTNDADDVYVHDRQTGETWRISVASEANER